MIHRSRGPPEGGPIASSFNLAHLPTLDDFEALCDRRAARATALAERFPHASEALRFYAQVALLQKNASLDALAELVIASGPEPLRQVARGLDENGCRAAVDAYASGDDRSSPKSFFRARLAASRNESDT